MCARQFQIAPTLALAAATTTCLNVSPVAMQCDLRLGKIFDEMIGKAVSVAETLAAVAFEPEKAAEKQSEFIRQGLAVAAGELHWEKQD